MFEKVKEVLELVRKDQEAAREEQREPVVLSDRTVENAADLNDRFSRARSMGGENSEP